MGKFLNKLINGDPNKKDFTKADLPHNRVELFLDVLKMRLLGLVTVNVIFLLFLLPLLLVALFGYYTIYIALTQSTQDIPTTLTEIGAGGIFNLILFICIPLIAIIGPAQAGMYYVIRNWTWGEGASPWKDFWKEFKRSWKPALVYNLFSGAFFYAVWFYLYSLLNPASTLHPYVSITLLCLIGLLVLFYLLMNVYVYPLMVTFNLKLKQILKNAMIFGLMQLPRTLLYLICIGALIALCLSLPEVLLVLVLVVGFSSVALGQMVYCGFVFDKYIKYITTDEVPTRRGMAPLTDHLGRKIKKDK